jgi:hypothetical protein
MGEGRGAYRILVGRPEGRRPLGRPRRRWEDNIKLIFKKWDAVSTQDVTNPVSLSSFYCMYDIPLLLHSV